MLAATPATPATPASRDAVAMLRTIAFDTVVAPQWHAAANHLPKISRALARRSGRAQFVEQLQKIRRFATEQYLATEALCGTL